MLILVDIDGTIADLSHRLHHIHPPDEPRAFISEDPKVENPFPNHKPDWDAFYDACDKDEPIEVMRELLLSLDEYNNEMVYVTGRPARSIGKTQEWLNVHGFPKLPIYCRADGDHRQDCEVKKELYENLIKPRHGYGHNLVMAIDDREQVVKMWRSLGILTLQCAEGKY